MNRSLSVAAVTAALTVLSATAAAAHPSFNPNQVPAGEPVEATLVVPHGCAPDGGMPDGDAVPTVEIALATTPDVTVEPAAVDGWEPTVEPDAVTWRDAGGATTDVIELPVTLTVTAAEGSELFLSAYQECEGGQSFRWIARPGEDGYPAVTLVSTAGDVDTVTPDETGHAGDVPDEATDDATDGGMDHDGMATAPAVETTAAGLEDDDGGFPVTAVVAVVLVVAAGGALVAARHRGSS